MTRDGSTGAPNRGESRSERRSAPGSGSQRPKFSSTLDPRVTNPGELKIYNRWLSVRKFCHVQTRDYGRVTHRLGYVTRHSRTRTPPGCSPLLPQRRSKTPWTREETDAPKPHRPERGQVPQDPIDPGGDRVPRPHRPGRGQSPKTPQTLVQKSKDTPGSLRYKVSLDPGQERDIGDPLDLGQTPLDLPPDPGEYDFPGTDTEISSPLSRYRGDEDHPPTDPVRECHGPLPSRDIPSHRYGHRDPETPVDLGRTPRHRGKTPLTRNGYRGHLKGLKGFKTLGQTRTPLGTPRHHTSPGDPPLRRHGGHFHARCISY